MPLEWIAGILFALVVLTLILWQLAVMRPAATEEDSPPNDTYYNERQQQLGTIAAQKGWSDAAYDHVLNGHIAPGMNQDMVLLAWGGPSQIDHKAVTPKNVPVERWVYRSPEDGRIQYVWFANAKVVRIEA